MASTDDRSTAREQAEPSRIVAIGCGSSHTLALMNSGMVTSWGRGEDGQLGHGDANERPLPQTIHALSDSKIDSIYCGAEYSAAVSTSGNEVYTWGWGDFGRLGHGDIIDVFIPKPVSVLSGIGITNLACGDTHTLALSTLGQVFSFGRNQNGQLGTGSDKDQLMPVHIEALRDLTVTGIACGAEHSLVSTDRGQIYSFGWGRYGNLGLGEKADRWVPTLVPGLGNHKIVRVACGWRHSVAVDDNGKIFTFGWSRYGQLGHGDNVDGSRAKQVQALDNIRIKLISGGWRHTIAADTNGQLYAWGWNKFGQLGIGSREDKNLPVTINGDLQGSSVTFLSCGWRHNFALTASGEVYSWGRGGSGQLGHGDSDDLLEPRLMKELSVASMDIKAIMNRGPPPSEGASYIPFADRYAVVPDGGESSAGAYVVPEVEPDNKRLRTQAF